MQELAVWIESTRISKALFDVAWLWPLCESIHFVGLTVLIGGAGLLDLRLLGLFRGVAIADIKAFMPFAIGGFLANVLTGTLFIVMQAHLYLTSGVWWFKVAFIVVAGLNALLFETRFSQQALALDPDADTTPAMKMIGGVSLLTWFAVLYCGRMLPYLGTGN